MKIKIQTKKLKEVIDKANSTTSKNNQNQNLKGIFFKTSEGRLIIKSTNLSVGYEKEIFCEIEEEGEFLVLGDVISRVFSSLYFSENSICELNLKDNILNIKVEKHTLDIKTMLCENFPELPKVEGVQIELNIDNIIHGFKNVAFSVAKTDIKPEISGVYVYSDKSEIVFVGTDSYRLSEKKIKNKTELPNFEFIIPEKNVKDILKLFGDTREEISLQLSKNSLSFKTKDEYFVTRLIEGKFPNYRQIMPSESIASSVFLKEDMSKSLKIVSFFSDKTEQIVLNFKENNLNIFAQNFDIGTADEKINTNTKGEDFSVKINSRYFEEFLNIVNENSIIIKYTAQNKPITLQGLQDSTFTYLVMPSYK